MKKWVMLVLVAVMTTGSLTGCKSLETSNEKEKTAERTFFLITDNTGAFNEEWPVFKKAEELTGVHLKGMLAKSSGSEATAAYNLMMASGEVANIVGASKVNIHRYVKQNVYVPLNDLIDQYAPNIKKYLEENPDIRKGITYLDGKIYFIPFVPDGEAQGGWFIRKDWLKKLGLSEPKTLDELYAALKAFKEKDPNGNGTADEVPIFQRGKNITNTLPLFGIRGGWQIHEGTDTVVFDKYSENYKTAMINIAKWYKEGIIDREIYTRVTDARAYMLQNNFGGLTSDWFTSTSVFNGQLGEKIPGFDFSPIAPPADINGKVWENSSRSHNPGSGWAISLTDPKPEETIKYLDFWFTEQGRLLANYGIEGETYHMVNSKPIFTDTVLHNKEKTVLSQLWEIGAQIPSGVGYRQDYWYEEQTLDENTKAAIKMYVDSGWLAKSMPLLTFTEEEQAIIDSKKKNIDTYVNEMEQQWVMGAKDVASTFDGYMNSLKEMGIEEIAKIYNEAYKRYKNL